MLTIAVRNGPNSCEFGLSWRNIAISPIMALRWALECNGLITAFQFDFRPDECHSYSILRVLLLVWGLVAGLSQMAAAQDRTLIAEGDYVAQSENGSKPVAHWKLSRLNSGEYEVTEP